MIDVVLARARIEGRYERAELTLEHKLVGVLALLMKYRLLLLLLLLLLGFRLRHLLLLLLLLDLAK